MRKIFLLLLSISLSVVLHAQNGLPKVTLKNIEGKSVDVSSITNDGKPIIISFFATWCKPCNRELKAIHEVYSDWQEETGVKLIAVKPLVSTNGWTYEVLLDPNSDLKRALGVQLIPYVLLLDGKGNIVYKHNGYTDGAEFELYEKVKSLCGK